MTTMDAQIRSAAASPFYWTDIAVPVVLALGMGLFIGALVFGNSDAARIAFNKDVLIAFAAAVGTWVVGVGAWHYARQAHALRIDEVERDRTEKRRKSAEDFNITRGAVLACMLPYQILSFNEDYENVSGPALRTIIRGVASAAPNVERLLSSPLMARDEYVARALGLSGLLTTFVSFANAAPVGTEDPEQVAPAWVVADFRLAFENAKALHDQAQEFSYYLDEIRTEVQIFE